MAERRLALDACVLINLLATERMQHIAAACDARFVIVDEVASEAFFLRDEDVPEGRRAVDLAALVTAGELEVIAPNDTELDAYVAYAMRVDAGEAASIAVAAARGWPLATDDRAALRLLGELGLVDERHTTPSLMRMWAANETAATVAAALRAIEHLARFVPGDHDPDAAWWRAAIVEANISRR